MNKKYFSTDMSSAPRCIHDYVSPELQAHAAKVAQFYDKKLKELDIKVANPSYEHDSSVAELKRIAPDGNPRTGLRMVKNMISAELMHIPATKQIHASVDIGGVAKYMHEHPANALNTNSVNASSASAEQANTGASSGGVRTNTTSVSLIDMAKHAGETFTKRVNKLASAFVDITGINKAKRIFKNVGKEDFLGQLETYVNFMRTMTAEWLMLATSKNNNTMDKKLFCCLLKGIKGGPVDVSQLISALAKLKAFLNVTSNILNVYNSFLSLINRTIKILVAAASSMLSDLLSKFYYMLIIPYVGEAENAIAGKQIVSDGELEQAKKDMNTAFKVHGELEKHFQSVKAGDELKDCNFISALLGGIPLSMSDDLLRQLVKLLQIHVGEIGQQIHIAQLQTLDDIIDSLVYTLDNVTKLGALSANGAFCKDVDSGVNAPNNGGTGGNGGGTGNFNGSEPGAYDNIPNYGASPISSNGNNNNGTMYDNNGVPSNPTLNVNDGSTYDNNGASSGVGNGGSASGVGNMLTVNNNIKKILNNFDFFNNRFGYSGKLPANTDKGKDDYVFALVNDAKDALAKHLAQTLSEQLGVPVSEQFARMFIDARFGDGAITATSGISQANSPMAAYAKNLDEYVNKLS